MRLPKPFRFSVSVSVPASAFRLSSLVLLYTKATAEQQQRPKMSQCTHFCVRTGMSRQRDSKWRMSVLAQTVTVTLVDIHHQERLQCCNLLFLSTVAVLPYSPYRMICCLSFSIIQTQECHKIAVPMMGLGALKCNPLSTIHYILFVFGLGFLPPSRASPRRCDDLHGRSIPREPAQGGNDRGSWVSRLRIVSG